MDINIGDIVHLLMDIEVMVLFSNKNDSFFVGVCLKDCGRYGISYYGKNEVDKIIHKDKASYNIKEIKDSKVSIISFEQFVREIQERLEYLSDYLKRVVTQRRKLRGIDININIDDICIEEKNNIISIFRAVSKTEKGLDEFGVEYDYYIPKWGKQLEEFFEIKDRVIPQIIGIKNKENLVCYKVYNAFEEPRNWYSIFETNKNYGSIFITSELGVLLWEEI